MASSKLLKEAIADAKAVRETAIANAKIALEEAFTPRLQSILSKKLTAEMEGEEEEADVNEDNDVSTGIGTGDNKEPADQANSAQTDLSGISKETSPEGEELEVWATGFFGFYGKNKAQVLINKGYYHRFMFENDKHKKLISNVRA